MKEDINILGYDGNGVTQAEREVLAPVNLADHVLQGGKLVMKGVQTAAELQQQAVADQQPSEPLERQAS